MDDVAPHDLEQDQHDEQRRGGLSWWVIGGALAAGYFAYQMGRPRYDLVGKTVLIAGGSRGLGLGLARQLIAQGAHVAICARDAHELERAHLDLEGRGGRVWSGVCDLADQPQVERMVARMGEEFAPPDVLINNASIIQIGPLQEMTLEDFHEAMAINYWGSVHTILAVLPGMMRRGHGRIVNITSVGGKISVPHLLPYSASKFAMVGLSEGLRAELKPYGIVVTTVCPGLMRTGSPRNVAVKGRHREEFAWFKIADSLPLLSMSAKRAARNVIAAMRRGDAEVTLSLPAKAAVLLHGVAPGLASELNALVNRYLPQPGGIGRHATTGAESGSRWSDSFLTRLSDRAAKANNEGT